MDQLLQLVQPQIATTQQLLLKHAGIDSSEAAIGVLVVGTLGFLLVVNWVARAICCRGKSRRSTARRAGRGQVAAGDAVLMVGPCGGGKTHLFTHLFQGAPPACNTVTSMASRVKEGTFKLGNKRVTLVDLPGSPKAQNASLDAHLQTARAVVFVVEASTFSSSGVSADNAAARHAAQLLKRILTNAKFVARQTPLIIAFSKSDLIFFEESAKDEWLASQRIAIEAELDAIKDEMLSSTGEQDARDRVQLGSEEQFNFEFDVVSKVSCCLCTTQKGSEGIRDLSAEITGVY